MLRWIKSKVRELWTWGRRQLDAMTPLRRKGTILVTCITVGASVFGGMVFTMAGAALLANGVFWSLVVDQPKIMRFMSRFGLWIDICLTIASFFALGATLGAFLIGLMGTAYFTGFRLILCGDTEPVKKEKAEKAEEVTCA